MATAEVDEDPLPRMLDDANRQFRAERVTVRWGRNEQDALVVQRILVSGRLLRQDGSVGVMQRHATYGAQVWHQPIKSAPDWVRRFASLALSSPERRAR